MDTTSERTRLRDMLATDYGWTPRQREVLDLITRGKSNQEIADELGVSLDGAKWHMREILSKLNVDTREEAAEYWHRYNGVAPRFARLFRGVTGAGAGKWLAGALVGGALIGMVAVVLTLALSGDDDDPAASDTEPTSTPTSTAAAVSPTVSPTAAPTQGTPVARVITLDTSPQPQPPEITRMLGTPPDSVFPPWDGVSTVIYDVQTGNVIDLGPGAQPASFSPDETMAVFAAGDDFQNGEEIILVELSSGQTRSLGPGRLGLFIDNESVMTFLPNRSNERVGIDIATGDRSPFAGDSNVLFSSPPVRSAPPGYVTDPSGPSGASVNTFTVSTSSGSPLLSLEAVAVAAAGSDEVAAVAPPVDGVSNVYVVNLVTGEATFIASAIPGKDNFPFSATADYVLWTDAYCGADPGAVTLFDRTRGQLTRLDFQPQPDADLRYMRLTTGGLLAAGAFGAKYLIDPDSLAYVARIPPRTGAFGGDIWWSATHRYASHGRTGGHGGLCAG